MTRILLVLTLALSGCCTVAGGVLGGVHAVHHNHQVDNGLREERASVGNQIAAGAALGLLADLVLVYETIGSIPDEAIGGSGPR